MLLTSAAIRALAVLQQRFRTVALYYKLLQRNYGSVLQAVTVHLCSYVLWAVLRSRVLCGTRS